MNLAKINLVLERFKLCFNDTTLQDPEQQSLKV